MIFMLLRPMWGLIQELKENFEHLVHETWPWTCGWIIIKFCYKKQTKSENYEICHDIIRGGSGKKLRRFCTSCHVCCLQNKASLKNHRVKKNSLRSRVKATIGLGFDFKTFCI